MTKNRRLSLLILALILTLAFVAQVSAAFALPGVSPEDAKHFMPVSQLKRGMKGYGLTVFHGTRIERFDVEILGVLKQMNTGKDLILVRCGGGPITSRDTGIIAGMSGSPCYIDGKMVGAIAYGTGYAKEPVGMLTPVADMLEAWDDNLPKNASGYSSPQTLSEPLTIGGQTVRKIAIDETGTRTAGIENGVLHMEPLMTPLMVSGLSQRGIGKLAEILRPFNVQPMAGPGGGATAGIGESLGVELAPGAAVGMSLTRGDIDMTAIGTLTYRRGNRIVAFGHPMLGIGAVDAPMTTAFVADVVSSYRVSTKMASPIETVGRIFQDRPWSIAGAVGSMAKTIPATIHVDDQAYRRNRTYRVDVMNHPLLASRILTMIVSEAIYESHPTPGDATAEVTYEVVADQVGKITRTNVFFDPAAIDMTAISDIGALLQILGENRFHPLDIKSLDVRVRIVGKRDTATIDRIFVKESEYEPGDTVDIGVVLRPYKQERVTKWVSIKIPATAPDGKVMLQVRGGGSAGGGFFGMADNGDEENGPPMPTGSSGMAYADNVQQLVSKYLEREKNDEIVVRLLMRSTAINVTGEKLSGLPNAIADVMKSSRNSGLRMERDEVKQVFDADSIVYGAAQLSINVKRKDLNEKKPARPGVPQPEGGDESGPGTTSLSTGLGGGYDAGRGMQLASITGLLRLQDMPEEDEEELEEEESEPEEAEEAPPAPPDPPVAAASSSKPPTPAAGTSALSDVKTVVRQAKTWSQRTQVDFVKGTFSGVSSSSKNRLELVPTVKKIAETPEQFVWCVAPADDGVYAGTGDAGRVYHVTDSGEMSVLCETGELEVHALVRDSAGNLYAGTSPRGKVYRITPDGKGKLFFQTEERYVLALALDQEENLYVGVGDAGKVYKVAPDGTGSVFSETSEQQVLSLHWDPAGSLLVGTGINGLVYRIDEMGRPQAIYDASEEAITSVVSDNAGNVYAGTSPQGAVYKIAPNGRSKVVLPKATRVLSMARDSAGNIYAVSDGTLVKIAPDETVIQLDSSKNRVQFLALTFNEKTGSLYAGTGNIGSVFVSKCCDIVGTFESAVHDTTMISRWGSVKWIADAPEGTSVEMRTRVGNVATPDRTWTEWSQPYTNSMGERIAQRNARYIQYQLALKTSKPDVSPKVSSVSVSYLTPNQPPTVKLQAPLGGDVWAGQKTIKWVGSDPDKDTLTYDVFYSRDGGKEWKALVGGMSGTANAGGGKSPTEADITAKVTAELEKSKDVPEEMKKQVLKQEASLAKPPAGGAAAPAPGAAADASRTSYAWDTKGALDGMYIVKVVASDKTSNATDALTDEAISDPFLVCNTPPKLTLYKKSVNMKTAGSVTISGSAASEMVEVVGVQYRVNGGPWMAAVADDGAFDSHYETLTVITDTLPIGEHKIEVQAIDAAGNASSGTVTVKVSAGA